jgi:glutamate-1-semialdehyde 2,1-aminomutase
MPRITNFEKSRDFARRVHDVIPGGAHTYSKGDDQFPQNAPAAITHGKGARVWDPDGNSFVDCSMGLTAVSIGHGYEPVVRAVCEAAASGVNFQRPAAMELEAARMFLDTVQAGDMVKFAKNGSTVNTAAVKLARAFTGRSRVALCREHNFFSYDDWFIATTPVDRGIPQETRQLSKMFGYNDLESVRALFRERDHDIACLIMEPMKFDPPRDGFLQKVGELCREHGVVYILDEMISGFKWDLRGAQHRLGVKPDLSTWGKGIANGFSCCALTGRAEIMELGGIRRPGERKLFLISTTHGAETTGLAAMMATIEEFRAHDMIGSNWQRGAGLLQVLNGVIAAHRLTQYIQIIGEPCLAAVAFRNARGEADDTYRTLFLQEMIACGVLFQGILYPTWSHQAAELDAIRSAFDSACALYKKAIDAGSVGGLLVGPPVRPVFRPRI